MVGAENRSFVVFTCRPQEVAELIGLVMPTGPSSRSPDGIAACICPASMVAFYRRPDIAWVPITDVEPLRIALGWVEGRQTTIVERFAAVVREVAAERRNLAPGRLAASADVAP